MRTLLLTALVMGSTIHLCSAIEQDGGVMAYSMGAVLWQQTAAEAQALQLQGWQLADARLTDWAYEEDASSCRAVVVDLDETVLDNSPYQAWLLSANSAYPEGWADWTARGEAPAIPGAVECLTHAAEMGYQVYYVSNRKEAERAGTLLNLERLNLPQVEESHVLLRTDVSSKQARRDTISEVCEIVLLVGDNLADFAEFFEKGSVESRHQQVVDHAAEFGRRFIVMPNPMYGDWEGALYNYNYKTTPEERAAMRMKALRPMKEIAGE